MKNITIIFVLVFLVSCAASNTPLIPVVAYTPISDGKKAVVTKQTKVDSVIFPAGMSLMHGNLNTVDVYCLDITQFRNHLKIPRCFGHSNNKLVRGYLFQDGKWIDLKLPVPIAIK